MFSSLALETMNSVSPELTWKPCTKGRRSRKSVARNFGCPKRVMNTLVAGSDKVDGSGRGLAPSRRKEKVPIKKRRLLGRRSSSMKLDSPTAISEENEQPLHPSEDLYGIELLATVATMDDDFMNVGNENLPESSLVLKCSDAAISTSQSKELPKPSTYMCETTLGGGNSGCALVLPDSAASSETFCRSPNENNMYKVNRQHWDLNLQMDAWVEPFEHKQQDSEDQLLSKPDKITMDDVHARTTNQVLGYESSLETAKQVKMTEATLDRSHGLLMQEQQFVEASGTTAAELQDEVFSSNMILGPDTLGVDKVYGSNQDVTVCDQPKIEVSEPMIGIQCNECKDSVMASGRPHTASSLENVTPRTFRSHSEDNENNSNEAKVSVIPKPVDKDETNDEVKESIMSDARAQRADDPSVCVENNDLAFAEFPGDDVNRHVEMYDSSYEDGELRGSFLCSWEDNALENESVDYESDGRNVDGSYADEHTGYEILEGGSEGSHGIKTRNLKESDYGNNDVSGKVESNAGSGTTVEHCFELINEDDRCRKRRHLSDRKDPVAGKSTDTEGYPLKFAARQSYIDSLDRRNPYSIQRCRSHRDIRSFSSTTREVTPERYQGRRRPISFNERDGVDQFTQWASKKHFNTRCQGAEGHGYGNSSGFNRWDDVDHRKTANNMSIRYHKPFMRKSSLDKDGSLGIRRTPFGQGTSRYTSRGCYSQRASRDFGEHFEPPHEHDTTHVTHLPPYSSRREHSFSPNPGAGSRFSKRLGRSRSRSRTPSRVWQPHRDQRSYTMKHSRSRDFGYKVRRREGRVMVPFSKSAFASEYEDNYSSPPSRRRFSPIRRLVDDRSPPIVADNNIRHRRSSPVGHLRRTCSKFDNNMGSWGVKDEHRRIPFKPREAKLESTCDDNGEVKHRDNGGGNVQSSRPE